MKPCLKEKIELTTVVELIEELKKLQPETNVYVNGTYGYMHIGIDFDGNNCVTFDDDSLEEEYKNGID